MRKRRGTIPGLEAMEERMVCSAVSINFNPPTTAQIDKLGRRFDSAATSFQKYLNGLIQRRTGQAFGTSWHTHHFRTQHHSTDLFGIPFIKI
jgi:hypothetical protein